MIQAYNFLYSWQLFPEKGTYEYGNRPKSGIYKLETNGTKKEILVSMNWVTLENQAFTSQYTFTTDADEYEFDDKDLADQVTAKMEAPSPAGPGGAAPIPKVEVVSRPSIQDRSSRPARSRTRRSPTTPARR